MDDYLERLQPIFREVLDAPDLVLSAESSAKTVPGWDSLAHITIVSAIEQDFHIRFALGELEKLNSVGEMIALMRRKTKR